MRLFLLFKGIKVLHEVNLGGGNVMGVSQVGLGSSDSSRVSQVRLGSSHGWGIHHVGLSGDCGEGGIGEDVGIGGRHDGRFGQGGGIGGQSVVVDRGGGVGGVDGIGVCDRGLDHRGGVLDRLKEARGGRNAHLASVKVLLE